MEYEEDYVKLLKIVLKENEFSLRETRNDNSTLSVFGLNLSFTVLYRLPLLLGRHIYYKGVLGELSAFLKKPKHIKDFEKRGCNFWKLWAKEDGSIKLDYGNEWHRHGQIERLKYNLRHNPTSRRLIINGWNPANLNDLDLPCCHMLYQFYVKNNCLSMIWYQRSVDMMIGLPSNMISASAFLVIVANEFGLIPHKVHMNLGDCHIYSEHIEQANKYIDYWEQKVGSYGEHGRYQLKMKKGTDFCSFEPDDIIIHQKEAPKMKFKLYQ